MKRSSIFHVISYSALFVLFTFLFFLANYPSARLADQVNSWVVPATDGSVRVDNAGIRFPLSVHLDGITMKLDQGSISLGKAVVDPHLLGFIAGKRAADVKLENPWLELNLTFGSSSEKWNLNVRSAEIDLSRLPKEIMTFPVSLKGKVDANLKLRSEDPSDGVTSGDIRITSGPVTISGDLLKALGFDPLSLSRGSVVATVKDNVVSLKETDLEGDLTASARGQIKLNTNDIMASRLDLILDVRPSVDKKERFAQILKLLNKRPRADGSTRFRIRGTLGKPSMKM